MRKSPRPLTIAARRSPLAQAQTQMVAQSLLAADPELRIEFRWIESEADRQPDASLAQIGGKGLFVRAVEKLVLEGQADLAVHSLKDLPALDTPGLTIAATPLRADVRDCLLTAAGLTGVEQLPQGASVGTSSPRRAAQLLRLRPDLRLMPLRGNVETRCRKVLVDKQCDATLLAVAGLLRAGLAERAQHPIPVEIMLPAAGQGALALQCRCDDHVTIRRCLPVNDAATSTTVHAERQVSAGLGASCHAAIGVLAEMVTPPADQPATSRQDRGQPHVRLRVRVLSTDGKQVLEADDIAPARHVGKLVKRVLKDLKARGAVELLAAAVAQA